MKFAFLSTAALSAFALALATPACAQNTPTDADSSVNQYARATQERYAKLKGEEDSILAKANTLSGALGAEMLLQHGQPQTAFAYYVQLFQRTPRPELAERAMQIALDLRAFREAEAVFRRWQTIEPNPGEAQVRMGWQRDVLLGRVPSALAVFPTVLDNATDAQKPEVFLYIAQLAVINPGAVKSGAAEVHRQAARFNELPEAALADALYASLDNNTVNAVAALNRLSSNGDSLRPATRMLLELIARTHPDVLLAFFKQADSTNLPAIWQRVHIDILIRNGDYAQASAHLDKELAANPTAARYLQAALVAHQQKAPAAKTNAYLDKAYALGNADEASRAAIMGSALALESKNYTKARQWLERIKSENFAFDKNILLAQLAQAQEDNAAARRYLEAAARLPNKSGFFFNSETLEQMRLHNATRSGQPPEKVLAELTRRIAQARKAKSQNPQTLARLYLLRGIYYAETVKDSTKALADFRQAHRLHPNDTYTMNALGYSLLGRDGASAEAFSLLQAAYAKDPENPAISDSLGWAYYLRGDYPAALPLLEYAYRNSESQSDVAAHYAAVLWQLGRRDEARAIFDKAHQSTPANPELKKIQATLPGWP